MARVFTAQRLYPTVSERDDCGVIFCTRVLRKASCENVAKVHLGHSRATVHEYCTLYRHCTATRITSLQRPYLTHVSVSEIALLCLLPRPSRAIATITELAFSRLFWQSTCPYRTILIYLYRISITAHPHHTCPSCYIPIFNFFIIMFTYVKSLRPHATLSTPLLIFPRCDDTPTVSRSRRVEPPTPRR